VPWPAVTATDETPVPAAPDQLKTLLSSEPERLTANGAASWATVAIGLSGGTIDGGSFGMTELTWMLTARVTAAFTLSESEAVKLAVPLKPDCRVTV
jgi:hypothetical protein